MAIFKFVSSKSDGLGSRLKSILIAMNLANRFGVGFAYRWQPKPGSYGEKFHSVETVDSIFKKKFIEEGLISEREYRASNYLRLKRSEEIDPKVWARLVDSGAPGAIVDALQPNQILAGSGNDSFAREFEEIEFSPAIAEALEAASSVEIPSGSVAVHVRGGDIIYGPFKHMMKHQDKAVPLPLVRDFVEEVLASGRTPVVFMQDPEDRKFTSGLDGVVYADAVCSMDVPTSAARSMYDIKLMSRCDEIYSGSSRFSELASMISGKALKDINLESDPSAKFATIERECCQESRYSPEHLGFSILAQLYCGFEISSEARVFRLDRAQRVDPTNGLYELLAICVLVEAGQYSEAESRAVESISRFNGQSLRATRSLSEVSEVSPMIFSFLRQCYSVGAIKKYLEPLVEGRFDGFPVLSTLRNHLHVVLGRDVAAASPDGFDSVGALVSSLSKYLCEVRRIEG